MVGNQKEVFNLAPSGVKLSDNVSRLCEGKGLEALNFKLSTND
jgi:hypothetical protein